MQDRDQPLKEYAKCTRKCYQDYQENQSYNIGFKGKSKGGLVMGQKVNPHGLRVGIIKDWDTKWYANKRISANTLLKIKN